MVSQFINVKTTADFIFIMMLDLLKNSTWISISEPPVSYLHSRGLKCMESGRGDSRLPIWQKSLKVTPFQQFFFKCNTWHKYWVKKEMKIIFKEARWTIKKVENIIKKHLLRAFSLTNWQSRLYLLLFSHFILMPYFLPLNLEHGIASGEPTVKCIALKSMEFIDNLWI